MPGVLNWGYYPTTKKWVPLRVDEDGSIHVVGYVDKLNDIGDVNVPAPGDGNVLYWDDAAGKWKDKAHADLTTGVHAFDKSCRVTHSIAVSIPNATPTIVPFDTERWDTDGMHDNVTNNSRITCKTAGQYLILATISFEFNTAGNRYFNFLLNGVDVIGGSVAGVPTTGFWSDTGVILHKLKVDDYVEVRVYQSSGAPLNSRKVSPLFPEFMMARIA